MRILSTRKISASIEEIVDCARNRIIIVSPYLKIANTLVERIFKRLEAGVHVFFLFGKVDNDFKDILKLKTHKNCGIYYLDNLHAKVYLNENTMLLTSMNLHSFSESNNWELGIQTDSSSLEYKDLLNEIDMMFNAAKNKSGICYLNTDSDDSEVVDLINDFSKLFPDYKFSKIQTTNFDDSIDYSYEVNIGNFKLTSYKRCLELGPVDKATIEKAIHISNENRFPSELRIFTKSKAITFYPKDGFNNRLDEIEFEEYKTMWATILKDLPDVLKLLECI